MTVVAFDVDGTLIDYQNNPRHEIINFLVACHLLGMDIIVWSGGGKEYAERWVRKLELQKYVTNVTSKGRHIYPDITVDDADVTLGKVNIKVGNENYPERW